MIVPQITMLYAGILALFIIPMAVFVISRRFKHKIPVGSGRPDGLEGERDLLKAVRIHGNFIEYVPIILFLLLLLELHNGCPYMLHALGITLVVARIMHAMSLYKSPEKPTLFRFLGMVLTFLVLMVSAVMNIMGYFGVALNCLFI